MRAQRLQGLVKREAAVLFRHNQISICCISAGSTLLSSLAYPGRPFRNRAASVVRSLTPGSTTGTFAGQFQLRRRETDGLLLLQLDQSLPTFRRTISLEVPHEENVPDYHFEGKRLALDKHGKISGAAFVNQPGPSNTRTVATIGISVTYTINTEGIGIMNLTIALPGSATANVTDDFVITKSKTLEGVGIAAEI